MIDGMDIVVYSSSAYNYLNGSQSRRYILIPIFHYVIYHLKQVGIQIPAFLNFRAVPKLHHGIGYGTSGKLVVGSGQ